MSRRHVGLTATGALDPVNAKMDTLTVQCVIKDVNGALATPTALKVNIEGSLNGGSNWDVIGAWDLAAPLTNADIIWIASAPVPMFRANVATWTAGATATNFEVFLFETNRA